MRKTTIPAIPHPSANNMFHEKTYDLFPPEKNIAEKYKEASEAAQSCVDLKSKFGGGWLELGIAARGNRNNTRAKKYFEEARKDRDWRKMAERKIDEINNPAKYEK